jgi:hypothetical protein
MPPGAGYVHHVYIYFTVYAVFVLKYPDVPVVTMVTGFWGPKTYQKPKIMKRLIKRDRF